MIPITENEIGRIYNGNTITNKRHELTFNFQGTPTIARWFNSNTLVVIEYGQVLSIQTYYLFIIISY